MMNMNKSRELIRIKKTHKILHIHDEKSNLSHEIICLVVK